MKIIEQLQDKTSLVQFTQQKEAEKKYEEMTVD